jgi:hypothetical protein
MAHTPMSKQDGSVAQISISKANEELPSDGFVRLHSNPTRTEVMPVLSNASQNVVTISAMHKRPLVEAVISTELSSWDSKVGKDKSIPHAAEMGNESTTINDATLCVSDPDHSSPAPPDSYSSAHDQDEHGNIAGSEACPGPIAESAHATFSMCSTSRTQPEQCVQQETHLPDLLREDGIAGWIPLICSAPTSALQPVPKCRSALVKASLPPVTLEPFLATYSDSQMQGTQRTVQKHAEVAPLAPDAKYLSSGGSKSRQASGLCFPVFCKQRMCLNRKDVDCSPPKESSTEHKCTVNLSSEGVDDRSASLFLFPAMCRELVHRKGISIACGHPKKSSTKNKRTAQPICEGAESSDAPCVNPSDFIGQAQMACAHSRGADGIQQHNEDLASDGENDSAEANLVQPRKEELIGELADLIISAFEEDDKDKVYGSLYMEGMSHAGRLEATETASSGITMHNAVTAVSANGVRKFLVSEQENQGNITGPYESEAHQSCHHTWNSIPPCSRADIWSSSPWQTSSMQLGSQSTTAANNAMGCGTAQPFASMGRRHRRDEISLGATPDHTRLEAALEPSSGPELPHEPAQHCVECCCAHSLHGCQSIASKGPDTRKFEARLLAVIESPAHPRSAAECTHIPESSASDRQHGCSRKGCMERCARPLSGSKFLCVMDTTEPPRHPTVHSPWTSSSVGPQSHSDTDAAQWTTALAWVRQWSGRWGSSFHKPRRKALLDMQTKRQHRKACARKQDHPFRKSFVTLKGNKERQAQSPVISELDAGKPYGSHKVDDLARGSPTHVEKHHVMPSKDTVMDEVWPARDSSPPSVTSLKYLDHSKQNFSPATLTNAHELSIHSTCPAVDQKNHRAASCRAEHNVCTEKNQERPVHYRNTAAPDSASVNADKRILQQHGGSLQHRSCVEPHNALAAAPPAGPATVHLPKSLAWKLGIHGTIMNGQGHCIVVDEPTPRRPRCRQGKQSCAVKSGCSGTRAKLEQLKRNINRRHVNVCLPQSLTSWPGYPGYLMS